MKWLLVTLVAGCTHVPRTGELLLHIYPPDARVLLDDRDVGTGAMLENRPLRLRVGLRRVEVEGDGHYSVRREVEVAADKRSELTVELHAIPNGL